MKAREYLDQAYKLDQRINSKLEQISVLNDLARKATGIITGMPHSPNHGESREAHAVEKIVDLQDEIRRDADELVDVKRGIMHVIKAVDDVDCRLLLEMRYLCYRSWEQIAVDMGYCIDNIYRLHRKALRLVEEVLESLQ